MAQRMMQKERSTVRSAHPPRIDNYSAFDADKIIWWEMKIVVEEMGDKSGGGAVLFCRQDDE